MNSALPLRKVRDFGQKVNDTVRFLRLHGKDLLVMYGIFVLPLLLLAVLLGAGFLMDAFSKMSSDLEAIRSQWKIFLALILIFLAFVVMSTSIYVYMKKLDADGKAPSVNEVARALPRPVLSNFLYTLLMIGAMVLVFVPISFMFSGMNGSVGVIALLMMLAMFGFLFLTPYFVLVYPSNTIGGMDLGGPLRAPLVLLRGSWWPSLGYLLVIMLIYYVLSTGVQLFLTIGLGASTMLRPGSGMDGFGKGMGVVYGLMVLLQQMFYIVTVVAGGILYFSLHEEKIGSGLEDKIAQLGMDDKGRAQEGEY